METSIKNIQPIRMITTSYVCKKCGKVLGPVTPKLKYSDNDVYCDECLGK